MEEKDLLLEVINVLKESANKTDEINKRLVKTLIIITLGVTMMVSIAYTVSMSYFIHDYFNADYQYPGQTIENTNTNTNK
ncbi:MAG TPA: hypothetical protein VMV86_01930 [Methanosarcinales archaeon]|nr:hypothetical protein [Methanosarcinales archaeon]